MHDCITVFPIVMPKVGAYGTGRATNSPRSTSYGEDPRALPAIPDQLNALGLAPIPEDGLSSLGLPPFCFSLLTDCPPPS